MGLGISRILTIPAGMALLAAVLVVLAAFVPLPAHAVPAHAVPPVGNLTITVEGVQAGKGAVRVNLYGSAAGFLVQGDAQIEADIPPGGAPDLVFRGLPPGRYAAVAYYDLNGNGKLDRGLFGVPLEPLGFSNGVVPVFSAPDFAQAAFVVEAGEQGIRITLHNFTRTPQAGS